MRWKAFTVLLLSCIAGRAFAQDVIHTIDTKPIQAKVLEIGEDYIWYKTFDNLEGPDYKLSVSRVTRIVFENGTVKSFAPSSLYGHRSPYVYDDFGPYGPIDYRWGHYYGRRGRIYDDELADYIGVSLYGSDYMKAKSQYFWGLSLTGAGATLIAGAIIGGLMNAKFNRNAAAMDADMARYGMESSSSSSSGALYVVGGLAGAACLGVGIPIWVKGNRGLNKIADDYNRNYGRDKFGYAPSLSIGSTGNGVGLALVF